MKDQQNLPKGIKRKLFWLKLFPKYFSKSKKQVEFNVMSIYNETLSVIHKLSKSFIKKNGDLIQFRLNFKEEKPPTVAIQASPTDSLTKQKRAAAEAQKQISEYNNRKKLAQEKLNELENAEAQFVHLVNSLVHTVKAGLDIYLSKISETNISNPFEDFNFETSFIYKEEE